MRVRTRERSSSRVQYSTVKYVQLRDQSVCEDLILISSLLSDMMWTEDSAWVWQHRIHSGQDLSTPLLAIQWITGYRVASCILSLESPVHRPPFIRPPFSLSLYLLHIATEEGPSSTLLILHDS